MAGRFQTPNEQFLDENGNPIAGGKLAFFESGTSNPQDTFSDDALTVPNTNPVILDDAGRAGDIFLTDADYKVTLSKADDTVVWTADPVRAPSEKSSTVRTVSTATELDASDDGRWIAADATAGGFVITLPLASEVGNGYRVTIQKVDTGSNVVTVDGKNSDRINGATTFDLTAEFSGATFQCDGATWYALIPERVPLPRGYIDGFVIDSVSVTESRLNPGKLRNSSDTRNATLSQALTKKINEPWAQGNNQGGLFTGGVAADTTYHYILIQNNTSFAIDWGWDTDPGGANTPNGWTALRRVGSRFTNSSSEISATTQHGDDVYLHEHVSQTLSGIAVGTPPTAATLTQVPSGVVLLAKGTVVAADAAGSSAAGIFSFDVTAIVADRSQQANSGISGSGATFNRTSSAFEAWTNDSAQVKSSIGSGDEQPEVIVLGWKDPRGKDS